MMKEERRKENFRVVEEQSRMFEKMRRDNSVWQRIT
jgi:hypothetical protein